MKFNDGRIYEGNFLNGTINGTGKMIYSNGDIFKVSFKL
jgi:hypothetical protein